MSFIERIIKKLKGDSEYKWEGKYSFQDISIVVLERVWQIIRGLKEKIFLKESKGLVFVGRNVKIRHAHRIRVGKNFIVGDNSIINGFSVKGINIGENVTVGRSSVLLCTGVIAQIGEGITIGDGTGINDGAYLGGQGGIKIGTNVIVGPGVKMFSENHNFQGLDIPIKKQGVTRQPIEIGNDCWIGANAIILSGAVIGNGCVVAAGAVVNKPLPDFSVAAGVPAKIIKNRKM